MTLTLYHFSDAWGLDPSPFCAKVQIYLRLCDLPHRAVPTILNALRAPRGKLPFIDDDGMIIADSHNIVEHLKQKHGDRLDAQLSPEAVALGHVVSRMVEEGLYWIGVYSRWVEDDAWRTYRPVLMGGVPAPMRTLVAAYLRRDYRGRLRGQGLLRRPRDEIYALAARDIRAIGSLLGNKRFLLGPDVTSFDAVIYAFLGNAYYAPIEGPMKDLVAGEINLVAYLERMSQLTGLPG